MSDGPQGAGWWQASDGRWYPPEAAAPPPPAPPSPFPPPGAPDPAPSPPYASPGPPPAYPPQPYPAPPTTPPGATPTPPFGINQQILLVAAVVVAIGSCLTWATIGTGFVTLSKNGLDGDGVITLALAVGVGLLAGLRKLPVAALLGAIAILGVAVYDVIDIVSTDPILGIEPTVGPGLWVVTGGGVGTVVGAARQLQARSG